MITESQRDFLRRVIGHPHITKLQKHLKESGVRTRYGGEYSREFLSKVFNGHEEISDVEDAIWALAEKKVKDSDEKMKQREEFILDVHKREKAHQQRVAELEKAK